MTKRDDIYLTEIESRIENIGRHLKKMTQSRFEQSELHRSAVIRELGVIGEAANKISESTRNKFNSIPWSQMIGMRNRLIHGYFDVDHSIVWEVAKNQLPTLLQPVRHAILETAPPIHPWRLCPMGFYHVREHDRKIKSGKTSVRKHCRRNPSGKDQPYPKEIAEITQLHASAGFFISRPQLQNFLIDQQLGKRPLQTTKVTSERRAMFLRKKA